ncbi:MAG: hypothetical protein ACRDTX_00895 [Pseudonocardiaceae bacterium]
MVRGRHPGEAPLDALHRHLRCALERRDPISGLCDQPDVVAFYQLVVGTPALTVALTRYISRGEDVLTAALYDATPPDLPLARLTARLAACQILTVHRVLAQANQACIAAGETAGARAAQAFAEAACAFDLLGKGILPYTS